MAQLARLEIDSTNRHAAMIVSDLEGQNSIGAFSQQQTAALALQALKDAGFSEDRISIVLKTPPVIATEAKKSGIKGAIAGALGGGLAGLVLSFAKVNLAGGIPVAEPVENAIGLFLVGSLIGALSMGVMGAMTGVNVRKTEDGTEVTALIPSYVLFAKDFHPEELERARQIVQPFGSDFQE